uniref:Uncharacterized protein n=1 Tax=Coccidioides posadasii RMSCC 3488 TaxID=454284 RepID=A0A0J6F123_COCPO|nr:hypothetical protein CPAG_00122 [Coccidioides posadasii RMSCC 3488]
MTGASVRWWTITRLRSQGDPQESGVDPFGKEERSSSSPSQFQQILFAGPTTQRGGKEAWRTPSLSASHAQVPAAMTTFTALWDKQRANIKLWVHQQYCAIHEGLVGRRNLWIEEEDSSQDDVDIRDVSHSLKIVTGRQPVFYVLGS